VCLTRGEDWGELWPCLSCGWVAYSNDSPNQHAMAHYEETDHLVARLAWDRVAGAGLLAAHRGSPLRLRPTGDKPELAHQPADQLRADLPASADERDVLASVPVGAVEVVEQLRLWGGCWQLKVKERPTLAPHHSSSGSLLGRLLAG
jgi:Zn-finger in ubiquitin-hydrolases and other protein